MDHAVQGGTQRLAGPSLANGTNAVAATQKRLDDVFVPLSAGPLLQDLLGTFWRHARSIGAGTGHRIVAVRHGNDPREHRDRLSLQPVRIALAVEPFVVVKNRRQQMVDLPQAGQNFVTHGHVLLDELHLVGCEWSVLAKHRVGNPDLADVVQQSGQVNVVQFVVRKSQFTAQLDGNAGHTLAVTERVLILGVDGRGQRPG